MWTHTLTHIHWLITPFPPSFPFDLPVSALCLPGDAKAWNLHRPPAAVLCIKPPRHYFHILHKVSSQQPLRNQYTVKLRSARSCTSNPVTFRFSPMGLLIKVEWCSVSWSWTYNLFLFLFSSRRDLWFTVQCLIPHGYVHIFHCVEIYQNKSGLSPDILSLSLSLLLSHPLIYKLTPHSPLLSSHHPHTSPSLPPSLPPSPCCIADLGVGCCVRYPSFPFSLYEWRPGSL